MQRLKGTFTALVTPFNNGKVDYASLDRLLRHQLDAGIDGFVVNGTTAESPTLESEEVIKIFHHIRKYCGSQVPLILGTGSNSTKKTIEETKKAASLGADAALVVVPYYNKPPQRGLYEHFKATASSTQIPIILYNVPGRTVTTLSVETIVKLSEIKNIVGIKEASGKIDFAEQIIKGCHKDFVMLSGDDESYVEFLAVGGHGVISVASHIIPKQMIQWRHWAQSGQIERARAEIQDYKNLINLLFVEANPIPVKKALALIGVLETADMRLPLVECSAESTEKLKIELKKVGLL
jgi:4-hydroxy-tetrahydrodipicolinate synthase